MIEIVNYVKPKSLKEAYELNQKKGNAVIGGMLWLKMQKKRVGTAIDLSDLGLDTIEEVPGGYRIGAMVPLRQLEQHEGLNRMTEGAARESVRHIVGVQFRNLATVGGSIFGRYGFSDVLTFFMAVGASVELYQGGTVSIEEFVSMPYDRDILTHVFVPIEKMKAVYLSQRNTKTDFPVLTCCAVKTETGLRIAIGARPMPAVCFHDEKGLLASGIHEESAKAMGEYVKENLVTGSNLRGSSEYRSLLSSVLVRRSLLQIAEMEKEG